MHFDKIDQAIEDLVDVSARPALPNRLAERSQQLDLHSVLAVKVATPAPHRLVGLALCHRRFPLPVRLRLA